MFFTRIGKVIAHLVFWLASFRLGLCIFAAAGPMSPESQVAFISRYIGSGGLEGLGSAMDKAVMAIGIGITLGVLCEISARTGWSDRA